MANNPNWFPGGNTSTQRPHTAPAGPRQTSSPPLPPSVSLTGTSSPNSSSSSPSNSTSPLPSNEYKPLASAWRKDGKPPEKCWWSDSSGQPAAWRCRDVHPTRPQVRGWQRNKGDWNPANHRAWFDRGLEEIDKKWEGYPGLPDRKLEEEEKKKKKLEEEKKNREKEMRKEGEKKRKDEEKERFVKLPWIMRAMGLGVVKVKGDGSVIVRRNGGS